MGFVRGIGLKDVCQMDSIRCSSVSPETLLKSDFYRGTSNDDDDMCQIDDQDDIFGDASVKSKSHISNDVKVCIFFVLTFSYASWLSIC